MCSNMVKNTDQKLVESERFHLFQSDLFGKHKAEVLQKTVWWILSLHFGFRTREESRTSKWGDIVLSNDLETDCELLL